MSRDYPSLDEQYGIGAEQADAEAQDDIVAELQEAIDSPAEYSHRYWTEIAVRAVARLAKAEAEIERLCTELAEFRLRELDASAYNSRANAALRAENERLGEALNHVANGLRGAAYGGNASARALRDIAQVALSPAPPSETP